MKGEGELAGKSISSTQYDERIQESIQHSRARHKAIQLKKINIPNAIDLEQNRRAEGKKGNQEYQWRDSWKNTLTLMPTLTRTRTRTGRTPGTGTKASSGNTHCSGNTKTRQHHHSRQHRQTDQPTEKQTASSNNRG